MHPSGRSSRREFLQTAAVAGGAALVGPQAWGAFSPTPRKKLPTRPLGQTGRQVSMLCLGTGRIAWGRDFDDVVKIINYAIDQGITYIDTAEEYRSEPHVGKAIAGRRKGLFIATKTLQRGYDGAMRELEQSLKHLGTDRLDLWQVHSIGHRGEDSAAALKALRADNGVMKAMRKAKEQKIVDFIGFTGHTEPDYMLDILKARDLSFDTMLFTLSAAAWRQQRAWEERVLPAGRKRKLGLIAMKVFGGGRAVGDGKEQAAASDLLRYVWDRGVASADVGLYSLAEVDEAVRACRAYRPASSQPAPRTGAREQRLQTRLARVPLPYRQTGYEDSYRPWPAA
jgi:aryl-alcohol dehydrogenase-like predicted oxidoreductase